MARLRTAAVLIVALFALGGCSAFFQFNAFAALDTPPAPTLADYQGEDGLANLAADLGSPAVIEQLKGDPALVDQLSTYLHDTFLTGPLTTADAQLAAALYSDLGLVTTGGDTLVNNVVTTLVTTSPSGNIGDLITSIIPADVLADATGAKFTAMVQALLAADVSYQLLGNSIPAYGAPPGVNLGDVAQKAAVACMMRAVVDSVKTAMSYGSDGQAIDEIYLLVSGQPNGIDSVTVADPFSPAPGYITNLFDAAGAPLPA
jgi:hypothetical protein